MSISEIIAPGGAGSGGLGITTLLRCLRGCAKEVRLEHAHPEIAGRLDTDNKVEFGTLGHKHLAAYYLKQEMYREVVPLAERSKLMARVELLISQYTAKHTRSEFGRVIECEVPHPRDQKESAILDLCIYHGYSCKFDLVVKPYPSTCVQQAERYGLFLEPDCYYIVDHKFMGDFWPDWKNSYLYSTQLHTYMRAFEKLWPGRKLGGVILNGIRRSKHLEVKRILISPTTELAVAADAIRRLALLAYRGGVPNPEHCFYPKQCPFFGEHCSRTGAFRG